MENIMRETSLMARTRSTSLATLVGLQLIAVGRLASPGGAIPPGTDLPVTLDENVTLKRDQIGNSFPAHITRDVIVDGAVAIPAGAPAEVTLVRSEDNPNVASFRLVSVSIRGRVHPLRTDVAGADATKSGSSTGKKTGIGALAGGAIGLITGGGSGLMRGAAVGAGGGLAWGLLDHATRRVEHDTPLRFTLRAPVSIP
jgi:hypothetical protein